jgi:Methyltransferase domain
VCEVSGGERLGWRERLARRREGRPLRTGFVRDVLPRGGIGIELGVQYGDFSAEVLRHAEPEHLHLVDPWYLAGPEWAWEQTRPKSTIWALRHVIDRFADELVSGRVVLHIGTDLDVLPRFPDRHFDWAYLDSSHEYEHVRDVLALALGKVREDGLIAGDDWVTDPAHPHHGVCRAVRELVEGPAYELVYASENDLQWAVRRLGSRA